VLPYKVATVFCDRFYSIVGPVMVNSLSHLLGECTLRKKWSQRGSFWNSSFYKSSLTGVYIAISGQARLILSVIEGT
jgi:hypothetical protein